MELYKRLNNCDGFFLIAGPCVVEDENLMMKVAKDLIEISRKREILTMKPFFSLPSP